MTAQQDISDLSIEAQNARVTRRQLRGYGCSTYLARRATQGIEPIARQGSAWVYPLAGVIAAFRDYQQKPRVKASTKAIVAQVLPQLSAQLGNVVQLPFTGGGDPELRSLAADLGKAMQATDAALAQMKARVAEIKGKRV